MPASASPSPRPVAAEPRASRRVMGMTTSAFDPASRVRFIQFMGDLRNAGWEVDFRPNRPDRQWSSRLPGRWAKALHHRLGRAAMKWNRLRDIREAGSCDVVFLNRDLAGEGLFFARRLFARNPRVVFDYDDALFVGPHEADVAFMCRNAAWVTPGNEYLAEFARRHTDRVTVIPTVIDTRRYRTVPADGSAAGGAVRVGWSGSDQSIRAALYPYLPMLRDLQRRLGFEFVVVTNTRPTLPVEDMRFTFVPWKPEEEGEIARFMDVGLMPLVDDAFQRGKCGLKLLQYMAAGLPTVASPVGVNARITTEATGFLASDPGEWAAALETLVRSPARRTEMGRAGRRRCEEHYSVDRWLPEILAIFERVRRLPSEPRGGTPSNA